MNDFTTRPLKRYLMKSLIPLFIIFLSMGIHAAEVNVRQADGVLEYKLTGLSHPTHSEFFTSPRDDYTKGLSVQLFDQGRVVLNKKGEATTVLGSRDAYLTIFDKTLINPSPIISRNIDPENISDQIRDLYPNLNENKTYTIRKSVIFMSMDSKGYSETIIPVFGKCIFRMDGSKYSVKCKQ